MNALRWLSVTALLACGAEQGPEPAPGRVPAERGERSQAAGPARERGTAAATPEAARKGEGGAPADHAVLIDFLASPAWLDLRAGEALVVDLGGPSAARYTLGGWQTALGTVTTANGLGAAGELRGVLMPESVGRLLVPADGAGEYVVEVDAVALGPGVITGYVGDAAVATAKASKAGDAVTVRLPITFEAAGETSVQLRSTTEGALRDGGRGALLLTALRVLPKGAAAGPVARPALAEGVLSVPRGTAVAVTLEVSPGARLRAAGTADGLRAAVRTEGGRVTPLVFGADGTADLGAHAGEVVRLELGATADARLTDLALVTGGAAARSIAANPPKNVLVFLVDTLRADKLRPYAPKTRVEAPGLDAFARGAAVFAAGHTHENWTKPSVASLLSGWLPWQHQATTGDAVVPESVELLSERLEKRGFFTGTFIANGYVSDKFGFKQGWATYRNYIREGRRTQANFVAADVLEWLDRRPKEKPFFLYVHTIDPHVPYLPPDEFVKRYDPAPYDGPVSFLRDRSLLEHIKVGKVRLGERDKARLETLYDAEITFHDVHMHAIFEGLRSRGLDGETLVVITADHGEELFDHGSVGHGHSVYEELLHVPLLVRVPGVTEDGVTLTRPAGHVDVVPTVLDYLGMEVPKELPGRSLRAELEGAAAAPGVVVSGFMDGWRTANTGRWKLVHRSVNRFSLYDLAADPDETRDVAAAHPLVVRYLRGRLGAELARSRSRGARAAAPKRQRTTIDAETKAQLEALGYVGTQAK